MGTLVSRTLTPILCLLPAPSLWLTLTPRWLAGTAISQPTAKLGRPNSSLRDLQRRFLRMRGFLWGGVWTLEQRSPTFGPPVGDR